jgi:ABC-2 type transport system ATP-binding protein
VALLELDQVRKAYAGYVAVHSLSMQIPEGQIFGLLGPNGAGKTTAIRMMVGIILPDAGTVRLFGEPLVRKHLRHVGYLPEERGLYRKIRVRDHLLYLGELHGLRRSDARKIALHWAERLDIADWLGRRVEELSKGMQQKIQFIATILHRPRFVIMDEPFTGLDPVNTGLLIDILLELRREGATILFSTHRMDQVERLCDAICLIDQGRAVLQGEVRAIKSRFTRRSVLIAYEGDGRFLDDRRLIERRSDFGDHVEVELADGVDSQELLRSASGAARVTRFQVKEPSLEEIFIDVVGNREVVGNHDA